MCRTPKLVSLLQQRKNIKRLIDFVPLNFRRKISRVIVAARDLYCVLHGFETHVEKELNFHFFLQYMIEEDESDGQETLVLDM